MILCGWRASYSLLVPRVSTRRDGKERERDVGGVYVLGKGFWMTLNRSKGGRMEKETRERDVGGVSVL